MRHVLEIHHRSLLFITVMDSTGAKEIVKALADGRDPATDKPSPRSSPYQQADTVRALPHGPKRHPLRHRRAVLIAQMPVGFGHQQAAVLVAEPAGDGLEVYAGLDGIATKEMPQ